MIAVVAAIEAVAFAAAIVLIVRILLKASSEQAAEAARERSELLNRVQRPELLPPPRIQAFPEFEPESDDSALVGTIAYQEES